MNRSLPTHLTFWGAYESSQPRPGTPLSAFFKALVGSEFKVTLGEKYKIAGADQLQKKLSADNPQLASLAKEILSEAALREMVEPCFDALLATPVRPGDSWIRKRKLDMGHLGAYQIISKYTYEGKEGKLDRIKVKVTTKLQTPTKQAQRSGGLPFEIKKNDVRGRGAGLLYFDREKGRIVCLELNQKLSGTISVAIGGQDTQVDLTQTQKTTVKTMDANPLDPVGDNEEIKRLRKENEQLRRRLKAVQDALGRESKRED